MPDALAIGSALASTKLAFEIAKSLLGLRDAAVIQSKVIELQSVILSAQQSALEAQASQSALTDRIRELEEKVARMETWDADNEKYELAAIVPGIFGVRLKQEARDTAPAHWLCARCYERRIKTVLQFQPVPGRMTVVKCTECKSDLLVKREIHV